MPHLKGILVYETAEFHSVSIPLVLTRYLAGYISSAEPG